jgi:heme-degrading monooxygenase HmoA
MFARATELRILPGKLEEFTRNFDTIIPSIRRQTGFRALLVLRAAGQAAPEAMVVSVWDSLEDLKESENNLFLYQALARVMGCCEGFPKIREHEVLVSEFAAD